MADKRSDNLDCDKAFISNIEGKEYAMKIGAYAYVECSSLHYTGIQDVFMTASFAVIQVRHQELFKDSQN